MKKIIFLLLLPLFSYSQIKVQSLPTTTVGVSGDFLIKDKAAGGAGGTQKISIGNFLSTYSITTNGISGSSLTDTYIPRSVGSYSLVNSYLRQRGDNITIANGKNLTGSDTTKVSLDFGSSGSALTLTTDGGAQASSWFSMAPTAVSLYGGSATATKASKLDLFNGYGALYGLDSSLTYGIEIYDQATSVSGAGGIGIAQNLSLGASGSTVDQKAAVFINAKNATVNGGVKGAVMFGDGRTGTTNNTAYFTNVDIAGTGKFVNGNQGSGKVITSDASGNWDWAAPSGGGNYTGTVTASYIPYAIATNSLTNSYLSQSGNNITLKSGKYIIGEDPLQSNLHLGTTGAPVIELNLDQPGDYDLGYFYGDTTIIGMWGKNETNNVTCASSGLIEIQTNDNIDFQAPIYRFKTGGNVLVEGLSTFQYELGASNGYVLTSDASGNATWQPSGGGSGGVDTIKAGTGISIANSAGSYTITNSAPALTHTLSISTNTLTISNGNSVVVPTASLTAGTGISLAGSLGTYTVTNSGVTSVTGTANQITVSGTTTPTLSIPASPIFTGTTSVQSVSISKQSFQSAITTYTPSGTTQTVDFENGNIQTLLLTSASGNVTVTFSNPKITCYSIKVVQHASAVKNVVWPTIKWPNGLAPTITTVVNAVDVITIIYDGTTYYGSYSQALQ